MKKLLFAFVVLFLYITSANGQIDNRVARGANLRLDQGIGIQYAYQEGFVNNFAGFYDVKLGAQIPGMNTAADIGFTFFKNEVRFTADLMFPYVSIGKDKGNSNTYFEAATVVSFFNGRNFRENDNTGDIMIGANIRFNQHVKNIGTFSVILRERRFGIASRDYPAYWTTEFAVLYVLDITYYKS